MSKSDFISSLRYLLNESFLVKVEDSCKTVSLIEQSNVGKKKKLPPGTPTDFLTYLNFSNVDNAVVINHDAVHCLGIQNLAKLGKGVVKTCDAVFIGIHNDEPYILILDMKSVSLDIKQNATKMKCGKIFIELLDTYLDHFQDYYQSYESIKAWKHYYLICHNNISKKETKIGIEPLTISNDCLVPTYLYVEDNSTLSLTELISPPVPKLSSRTAPSRN